MREWWFYVLSASKTIFSAGTCTLHIYSDDDLMIMMMMMMMMMLLLLVVVVVTERKKTESRKPLDALYEMPRTHKRIYTLVHYIYLILNVHFKLLKVNVFTT